MSVLLMRLAGPMQSWGTQSRFTNRDTGREPSKSGVVGLLCAACGIPRGDRARIAELAVLPLTVRVDREGTIIRDFHTVGGGAWPGRKRYGVWRASGTPGGTVVSERFFLADADFLVAVAAPEALINQLQEALRSPVWPLYLGRKAFVPSPPVWVADGVRREDALAALTSYPWTRRRREIVSRLRVVEECAPEQGQPRPDVPVSFEPDNREYRLRYVRTRWILTDGLPVVVEGEQCTSHA